jgi:YbgC/YbaW family acyl-CoA thioester hydrolase
MSSPIFSLPMTVPFQDIDAAGMVFFARVFDYFHDAFVAHLASRGVSLPAVIADGEWGSPLAHAEADYKFPLRFGDAVRAEISRVELGETSFTLHHRIVSGEADGPLRVHATGRTVHVVIDRQAMRPRPLPDALRAAYIPTSSPSAAEA